MEHTALRPRPLPGRDSGGGGQDDPGPRPRAAHRRGRTLTTLLCGLSAGAVLILSGVGLGAVGATVIGTGGPAAPQRQAAGTAGAGQGAPAGPGVQGGAAPGRPMPSAREAGSEAAGTSGGDGTGRAPSRPARASLGLEAVDAPQGGARIVAVHVPGPGFTAGLVRGDVLLRFGGVRIGSATDLARAVDETHPGRRVILTVRHRGGVHQQLTVVPGVVT